MKGFIIALNGHDFSQKIAQECIDQASKFDITVEKFDAIYGTEYKEHMSSTGLFVYRYRKKMNLGHFGNFFSHYYLWEKCLKSDQPILVLEHDGYFIRPLPDNVLEIFDDILKLDCENPYSLDYSYKIQSGINEKVVVEHSVKHIHKRKKLGWYTWGSYGYIIKPAGARKLVTWAKQYGFTSTDNMIADGILTVSICKPSVIRLHPLFEGEGIFKYTTTAEMGIPDYEK